MAAAKVLGLNTGSAMQVCILDVSASGMRLRSKLPVPCGAAIEIEVSGTVSRGNVCRCEVEDDSYQLGVQFAETGATSTYSTRQATK